MEACRSWSNIREEARRRGSLKKLGEEVYWRSSLKMLRERLRQDARLQVWKCLFNFVGRWLDEGWYNQLPVSASDLNDINENLKAMQEPVTQARDSGQQIRIPNENISATGQMKLCKTASHQRSRRALMVTETCDRRKMMKTAWLVLTIPCSSYTTYSPN